MTTAEIGSIYGPRVRTTRQRINFWHGVDWDKDSWETIYELAQQRQRWVSARYGDTAFEDKPLLDGYSSFDLSDNGKSFADYERLLHERDMRKLDFLLSQQVAEHDANHFVRLYPFCPTCRGDRLIAALSLCSWMMRHPGRVPKADTDLDLDWDSEQLHKPPVPDQASLYLGFDDLATLRAPHDLIEGVVPTRGVGYITGRDRSLKTFLALDICMHTAVMSPYWHAAGRDGEPRLRRKNGFTNYGKFIFAAGEGVTSFYPRIEAWNRAQHVKYETLEAKTPEGTRAIRKADCDECATIADDTVGHVHHLELVDTVPVIRPHLGALERRNIMIRRGTPDLFAGGDDFRYLLALARREKPDIVVLDTLALSSGAADQQSNTEMGIVHERARQIADASEGVVIVIAHTDKGDNDARGASAIEDNADFVLHCERVDNDQLKVTVAKRKDADDNWHFMMAVEEVGLDLGQTSLILKDWDREKFGTIELDDEDEKLFKIAETWVLESGINQFTRLDLEHRVDYAAKTLGRHLDRLANEGRFIRHDSKTGGRGNATRYSFPPDWVEHVTHLGHGIGGVE